MPRLALFHAICSECRREHPIPHLGDFAYGQFILHRADGRSFRYLEGLNHDVWAFVSAHFPDPNQIRNLREQHVASSVIQETVAHLSDPEEGHSFCMRSVCPSCGGRLFVYLDRDMIGPIEVPDATFMRFRSMDDAGKTEAVEHLRAELLPGIVEREKREHEAAMKDWDERLARAKAKRALGQSGGDTLQ
jgi:hypothetical protein